MIRFSFLSIAILLMSFSFSTLQAQEVKKGINKGKTITKSLKVDNQVVKFSQKVSNTQKIKVTSNTSWKVVSKNPWLTVSPLKGNNNSVITITTNKANSDLKSRLGTVKIVEETGLERIIKVTQYGTRGK